VSCFLCNLFHRRQEQVFLRVAVDLFQFPKCLRATQLLQLRQTHDPVTVAIIPTPFAHHCTLTPIHSLAAYPALVVSTPRVHALEHVVAELGRHLHLVLGPADALLVYAC
jgi:hypothetical protein